MCLSSTKKVAHRIRREIFLPIFLGNSSPKAEVNKGTRLKSTTTGDERRNWKIYSHTNSSTSAQLRRQVSTQICEREEISVVLAENEIKSQKCLRWKSFSTNILCRKKGTKSWESEIELKSGRRWWKSLVKVPWRQFAVGFFRRIFTKFSFRRSFDSIHFCSVLCQPSVFVRMISLDLCFISRHRIFLIFHPQSSSSQSCSVGFDLLVFLSVGFFRFTPNIFPQQSARSDFFRWRFVVLRDPTCASVHCSSCMLKWESSSFASEYFAPFKIFLTFCSAGEFAVIVVVWAFKGKKICVEIEFLTFSLASSNYSDEVVKLSIEWFHYRILS